MKVNVVDSPAARWCCCEREAAPVKVNVVASPAARWCCCEREAAPVKVNVVDSPAARWCYGTVCIQHHTRQFQITRITKQSMTPL